jgi:beta-lactamase superfamily II metal-dependent hydrolase
MRVVLLGLLLAAGVPARAAELVTPSAAVREYITVRDAENKGRELARLPVGQRAELLGSTPSAHLVRLADGTVGYVVRRFTQTLSLDGPLVPLEGELELHFLDVGEGDATLVVCPDRSSLLIDAGSTGPVDKTVSSYLDAALGADKSRLDTVIVTHPDPQHFNLLQLLLRGHALRQVLHASELADYDDARFLSWLRGQNGVRRLSMADVASEFRPVTQVDCGGALVQVLSAGLATRTDWLDNLSIVVKISFGDFSARLPGDAAAEVEASLLQRYSPAFLDVDLLKLADGGVQGESNGPNFLAALQPQISVISNAGRNPAGAPHGTLLMQLQSFAAAVEGPPHTLSFSYRGDDGPRWQENRALRQHVYTTADAGNIVVVSDGSGFSVRTARSAVPKPATD